MEANENLNTLLQAFVDDQVLGDVPEDVLMLVINAMDIVTPGVWPDVSHEDGTRVACHLAMTLTAHIKAFAALQGSVQ